MKPAIALSPLRQVRKKDTVSWTEGEAKVLCSSIACTNSPCSASKGTFKDEVSECFSDI